MPARKLVPLVIVVIGLILVIGVVARQIIVSQKPSAGLKIETTPPALVFIDNQEMGKTPFEKTFRPKEVTIKIIPDASSTTSALSSYQTKVRLTANTYTVIKREFGVQDSQSAGETISLLPNSNKSASVSVVSSYPESASVVVDGQPQGFTPLSLSQVAPGNHQIVLTAPGYTPRTITAQALAGYKLTVIAKLAGSDVAVQPASPSATPRVSGSPTPSPKVSLSPTPKTGSPSLTPTPSLARPYVTITSTPTGFLRVRSAPSRSGAEIGQVKPGESYPLLDTDASGGWYQIQVNFENSDAGWVSSEYARKFE